MKTNFHTLIFLSLILPFTARAELHENVSFIQSVLNKISSSTSPKNYTCGNLVIEQNSCSNLLNIFKRDESTGMFFGMINDSPWDTCKKYLPDSKDISLNQLEKTLAENNRTGLGLRNNYFSSHIEECFPKSDQSKPEAATQKKIVLTMGYDYLNRLKKSTSAMSEEVKRVNSIIGDPIEKGLPCDKFSMPQDAKICGDIKDQKCKPRNELALYTDSLYENAIEPLIALKQARKALLENFSKTRTLWRPESRNALKDLDNKMKSIESQFPILKGKELAPFMASETRDGKIPDKTKLQTAIKNQLVENRTTLSKKLNENVDMNNCIVYGEESSCKDFTERFERVPPREEVMFFEKGMSPENRTKARVASQLYNTNQCLDDFRGLKNEFNSFAADFSINVGLTIFTGGTGLLARAGGMGVKMAVAGHRAMLIADAAFLGKGVDEAINTCSKELNKLESMPTAAANTNNACPVSLAAPESVVVANYQGCVTGAMMASLNALPFVPAAVSKYLARVKVPKTAVAEEVKDLWKFKGPKKAFDPHDLKSTGTILPNGKIQDPSKVFNRDGVYVYLVDEKGNMVISHRTPDLSAGVKEGDQFLATHRGLYSTLSKEGDAVVVAAGEIRVVGGVPVSVSPRAGSFHNTPEEVLENIKKMGSAEEKANADKILKEMKSIPPEESKEAWMVEMHMEDYLDANPSLRSTYQKVKEQLIDLTDKRLAITKESMSSKGLLPKDVETEFTRNVAGDAHIEGKAAAIAEINCSKSKSCSNQLDAYQKIAKKFIEKYKSPKGSENAVYKKFTEQIGNNKTEKDRAFNFLNQRSSLLFKEGPIEFMQNAHPEKFGLTPEQAMKYLDEWSKQF